MSNDQIILDQIMEKQRVERMPNAKKTDFFEIYVTEQVLKNFDLSHEEIESGLAGSANDGGIDSIYTFVNGELVRDDFDSTSLKKNISINVVIIQSKTSDSFGEEPINKLVAVTNHLFSLSNELTDFQMRYNNSVLSSVNIFRTLYTNLAAKFPSISFEYIYATRGNTSNIHPNVKAKSDDLSVAVKNLFKDAGFEFKFFGAAELLNLSRKESTESFQINFSEILTGEGGYIALVKLDNFMKFLTHNDKTLRKNLFDSNVRDYQGNVEVNADMQITLKDRISGIDFWWLNNGVTIVAENASQAGKTLTLEEPQIVNGQQTSREIFNYLNNLPSSDEKRTVMIRVIVATDAQIRDRIIKATNSQTTIPAASLRATEKIHRDIETYLAPYSIFYDRRKNSQKQQGHSVDKIISIGLLAQAMMSIMLQRPDDARARPSSLIKRDDDYDKIFNIKLPINIYLIAASLVKLTKEQLRLREDLDPKDRNNLLFYTLTHCVSSLTKKSNPTANEIAKLNVSDINVEIIKSSLAIVEKIYQTLGANEKIAKGPLMLNELKSVLITQYPSLS